MTDPTRLLITQLDEPNEAPVSAQVMIDQNTVDSISTMLGQMISATVPEDFHYALVMYKKSPTGEMTKARGIVCDGPPDQTVALMRHYADRIAADADKIIEHLAKVEVLNAEAEAKDATIQ